MFIRIVRGNSESTYECSRYTRHTQPGSENEIEFQLEGLPSQTVGVICDLRDTDIYVMNNEGKTIESIYRRQGSISRQ